MTRTILVDVALFAPLGLVLGLAYFRALRSNVRRFAAGAAPRGLVLSPLVRLAAAGAVLALVATQGAAALLAALGGFLAARVLVLRAARKESW